MGARSIHRRYGVPALSWSDVRSREVLPNLGTNAISMVPPAETGTPYLRGLARIGRRHLFAQTQVVPDRGHLFFGIAVEYFGERAFSFFEVNRHFGLWIDA